MSWWMSSLSGANEQRPAVDAAASQNVMMMVMKVPGCQFPQVLPCMASYGIRG